MKIDNAIILAAGTSSRFAPLSFERHKALTVVKDEVLIERQIRQLKEAGISDIYIVTGYKAEQFEYLVPKHDVKLIHNPDYLVRNNNASIWAVREILGNSFICSSDNYFLINPFESEVDDSYYAAQYAEGSTTEWCMTEDLNGFINSVTISGKKAWYMLGHAFWNSKFSSDFLSILESEYDLPDTAGKLWESIFIAHLDELKMKIRKYDPGVIYEFDTFEELRLFDKSYRNDTRSLVLKKIAYELSVDERDIVIERTLSDGNTEASGFVFNTSVGHYIYKYKTGIPELQL